MSNIRFLALILWIPFLLEATFIPIFTISIPGLPLTFGRICLLLLGSIGFNLKDKQIRSSSFRYVVVLLILGSSLGTIFSQNLGRDLISLLGFSILLWSAFGAAKLISFPETQKLLKFFFYVVYFYWVIFVFVTTISGGELISYGEIYRDNRETDESLINYHAFGLGISAATIYIAQINGWFNKLNTVGIVFVLTGIFAIVVTESRANLLITLMTIVIFYIVNNNFKVALAFRLGILLTMVGYAINFAMESNERLNRRYDVQNTEYIELTTKSRYTFVELTLNELIELPFGGGVKNNRVNYKGTQYQPHNQFLTFILFAGIFGIVADVIWIYIFSRTFIRTARNNLNYYKPYLAALTITMLVFLTNDISGAFFLLMVMFQTWLTREMRI